jgi:hypothetical protein
MINKEEYYEYIEKINKKNEEIKAIKSAECIMDYDAKTEIINQKMKAIEALDMVFKMTASAGV